MPMKIRLIVLLSPLLAITAFAAFRPPRSGAQDLDQKVQAFLDSRKGHWTELSFYIRPSRHRIGSGFPLMIL